MQGYVALVARGKYREALELIKGEMPVEDITDDDDDVDPKKPEPKKEAA